jgi:hypothetical protein
VVQFLGELLLTTTDGDETARTTKLGKLADSLRAGLAARYANPAAMAAVLLGHDGSAAATPHGDDDLTMVTADEKDHETRAAGTVRLPDGKRRKGTSRRDPSGSEADEEGQDSEGEAVKVKAERPRSRTPPPAGGGAKPGRRRAKGPGSPATASE